MSAFEMTHKIFYSYPNAVPFDEYTFSASGFMIEKATNKSLPIAILTATGSRNNFVISSGTWIPTKNNFTYDSGTGPITVEVDSGWMEFEAKRSQFTRAFTMCLFLINWALTIGSIHITLLVVFGGEKMDSAVLLLPITIVLIIPTLRGLYVGSPPYGVYIGKFLGLVP